MKLKRVIGIFTLTMYGVGIILGAGVYALVARAIAGLYHPYLCGAILLSAEENLEM